MESKSWTKKKRMLIFEETSESGVENVGMDAAPNSPGVQEVPSPRSPRSPRSPKSPRSPRSPRSPKSPRFPKSPKSSPSTAPPSKETQSPSETKPELEEKTNSDIEAPIEKPIKPKAPSERTFRKMASTVGVATTVFPGMRSQAKAMLHEKTRAIEDTLLFDIFKPLFILMKISGVFFVKLEGEKLFQRMNKGSILKSWTGLQLYCVIINIILLINSIRSLFIFDGTETFNYILFFKLFWCIAWYECASRAMLTLRMCWLKKKNLQDLLLTMDQVCYSDGIVPYEQSLRKALKIYMGSGLIFLLVNVGLAAFGFFAISPVSELFDMLLLPLVPHYYVGVIVWKSVVLLLLFLNCMVGQLTLIFFTLISYALYKEFEYLCRTFSMKIRDDGHFTDDLEKFRANHQRRCKLVEDADQLFKYYIANTYMTNVPILCLLLYSIIYSQQDIQDRLVGAFYLTTVIMQMTIVSSAATMINDQAHAPLEFVYSIRVHATTQERQLVINMFLNKLTGTSVGLTAWDMFVINKPAILTVVGVVLTYFFLLVQFQNPIGASGECQCLLTGFNGTIVTS